MKQLKYCGHNSELALRTSLELGIPYIGLIFHPSSPRYIDSRTYAPLLVDLKKRYTASRYVGVFVKESVERIVHIIDTCLLDVVQIYDTDCLHAVMRHYQNSGHSSPQDSHFASLFTSPGHSLRHSPSFWLALNIKTLPQFEYEVKKHNKLIQEVDLLLLDAHSDKSYGGTGTSFNWSMLAEPLSFIPRKTMLGLAGGIHSHNLAKAMQINMITLIDMCSGIEESPGKKDIHKMRDVYQTFKKYDNRGK